MPRFGSVLFDCDSTLSAIEGIEMLASEHRTEVAELTEAAMRGDIPLEQVYGRRLALVRPSRERLEALGEEYIAALLPDARGTVRALIDSGIDVRVISGGLLPAVRAVAKELGIASAHVAAVDVAFDEDGSYASFDETSPLTRSGGKREVVERWLAELPRPIMLVGDGATDLEARPVVDSFVGFAGVIAREAVLREADIVIHVPSLAPILALALGDPPAHPAHRAIFRKGVSMLESHPPLDDRTSAPIET